MKGNKHIQIKDVPGGTMVMNLLANAGDARDAGSIPGLERFPGVQNGNLLQHFCLENPMDRGTWRATAHGITKGQTLQHTHTYALLRGRYLSLHVRRKGQVNSQQEGG